MWLAGARRSRRIDARLARHISSSLPVGGAATARLAKTRDLPPSASAPSSVPTQQAEKLMDSTLSKYFTRHKDYLIVPVPLPADRQSATNDMYFADSNTMDQISIIGACLARGYDVPRAKMLFDSMRKTSVADSLMDAKLFNTVLEAYVRKAISDVRDREVWIEEAWNLYESMEQGFEKVEPTTQTYSVMLLAYHHFLMEGCATPFPHVTKLQPEDFVLKMRQRGIDPLNALSSSALITVDDDDDLVGAIAILSRAASTLGDKELIQALGEADAARQGEAETESLPEVKPVLVYKPLLGDTEVPLDENGAPIGSVPYNLSNLRSSLQHMTVARRVLSDDPLARQQMLEESVYDVALHRIQHENELFSTLNMAPELKSTGLRKYMWTWHSALVERLGVEISALERIEKTNKPTEKNPHITPYLRLLKESKLSILTIMEVMRLHGTSGIEAGVKVARALLTVGQAVELEHAGEACRKRKLELPTSNAQNLHLSQSSQARLMQEKLNRQQAIENEAWGPEWSQITRLKVGAFLVDLLMEEAKVTRTHTDPDSEEVTEEQQAAFTHTYEYVRGTKLGLMKFNPLVTKFLETGPVRDLVHPRHLPMLVKPKPWIDHDNGGYMFSRGSVMRIKDSQEQLTYLRQASAVGNMELVYSGLDVLGATPWNINRGVFDVVLEVWNSGQGLGSIPPLEVEETKPQLPEGGLDELDMGGKVEYSKALNDYNTRKANNHSERCSVNYKMEIARAFLGETFYFPHNIDFRGRAYPIPPHLNHMGDDLSRALLLFAESRPLGERGLRWLKIHLSNMFGYDKASFDDRVKFTEEHLEDVYDSADNPLTGRGWWKQSEDPWQLLATCRELTAAMRSPNPLEYESFLPVHQDGTCNGLQHYAALGGDATGAQQVNLDVTERPSDVYTFVANMVDQEIAKDVENGNELAKMVQGKIYRKLVKQTVMTTVYGVTYIGARDQILRQLKDRRDLFDPEHVFALSAYLARKTLNCIGDLFKGASGIQNWLTTTSRLISKSIPPARIEEAVSDNQKAQKKNKQQPQANRVKGSRVGAEQMSSVVWTTMLGLPIVQPYRKVKRRQILTGLQTVYIADPYAPTEVDSKKQSTAFPPNFIHSLDATHMMLTALECRAHNLTFASVHDSYWTHASTVDRMSVVIRDTFIALHGSDVLQRLYDEFKVRYEGHVVPVMVKQAKTSTSAFVTVTGKEMQALPGEEHDIMVKVTSTGAAGADAEAADLELAEDGAVEGAEDEPQSVRMLRSRMMSTTELRRSKMVDLWALVPPLPSKGAFDVNRIRDSQYFFS